MGSQNCWILQCFYWIACVTIWVDQTSYLTEAEKEKDNIFASLSRLTVWWSLITCNMILQCFMFLSLLLSFGPPHLHLTTSKVMVIVWRLRGNIIRTVLYIANVLPLQWAQLTETVHTAWLGLEFVFLCFSCWIIYLYVCVCFVLPWTVESFPFMFWRWCNKLKWAPFELFAPSPLLRLRSWLHPFRGLVNKKQCETRGLFMSLVIHYWIGDAQDSQGVSVSQNANYKYF